MYFPLLLALMLAPAPPAKIPALIVSGVNNHDCAWTGPNLQSILNESGLFEAELTNDAVKTLSDAAALARFKVILLDYNGPRWGEPAESNFLAAVKNGTGVVVVHAANNAFGTPERTSDWVEYEKLVGHLWRQGTGHGEFHSFDVRIVDATHPITRGLGELRRHPDELYHNLIRMHDAQHRPLAVAFSAQEKGGSGNDEPMMLVGEYGKGRVFHTPLGHVWPGQTAQRASQTDPAFRRLIARGCEWAATGDVQDEWIELFNGKDLAGWHWHYGLPGSAPAPIDSVWSVKDGAVVCAGTPAGYIRTERDFKNFILEVDWRWEPKSEGDRNSGVLFRMTGKDKVWPKALEAQLMNGEAGDFWQIDGFGASTDPARRNGRNTKKTRANEKPIGEWNHYRITVDRGLCVLEVNGEILNEAHEIDNVPGKIALQSEGAEIWFRNVRVLPLR